MLVQANHANYYCSIKHHVHQGIDEDLMTPAHSPGLRSHQKLSTASPWDHSYSQKFVSVFQLTSCIFRRWKYGGHKWASLALRVPTWHSLKEKKEKKNYAGSEDTLRIN
eukprot:1147956-Pelagomonas_calceolata.AAC.3